MDQFHAFIPMRLDGRASASQSVVASFADRDVTPVLLLGESFKANNVRAILATGQRLRLRASVRSAA